MTVIVLTEHEGFYYMTGDGRTSQDWMGIASDNSVKVHEGKECIYGTCGNASAKLVIKALLDKTRDPLKLMRLMKHKDFKDILQNSSTLVATKKHGCFTLGISKIGGLVSGPGEFMCDIVTWDRDCLPQIEGSGFLSVRTLLSQYRETTPEMVKDAIEQSYTVNHTIGGKITQVKLKIGK